MTPQEIFNRAYLGVLKQKLRTLRYFSEGSMCAVGHVLGPVLAQQWAERSNHTRVESHPMRDTVPEGSVGLLSEIQTANDRSDTPDHFKARMAKVALKHNLEVPPCPDTSTSSGSAATSSPGQP